MVNQELTEEQAEQLVREMVEQKQNVHTFFRDIIKAEDTTKTGNLSQDELGVPNLPIRSIKELELFSKDICSDQSWEDYFRKLSEVHTSTSLSKDGILIKLSVTSKKELADLSPKERKKNKGWFKKKEE